MKKWIVNHWGHLTIALLLLLIVITHFQPGKYILGNDNFSPELNPQLTIKRSLQNPAWRTYRALGVPSDSEQADIWRSSIYSLLELILPSWLISQLYLYICLIIGVVSMGKISQYFIKSKQQSTFFLGSLIYLTTLNTAWIFFYPVNLFVAAYAFLPLIILSILSFLDQPSRSKALFILLSSCLFSTAALTATMFITGTLTLLAIIFIYTLSYKIKFTNLIKSIALFFLPHLFWILPFITYVQTNADALQLSKINREITSTTIQSEIKYNTATNTLRHMFSWLDIQEDGKNHTFPHYDWIHQPIVSVLLYLPFITGIIGTAILIKKKKYFAIPLLLIYIGGWLLITGVNPPTGFIYQWMQENIPLFRQVFRWQSSKLWPLMTLTLPILASSLSLIKPKKLKIIIILTLTIAQLGTFYFFFTGQLIRKEVYVTVPPEYQALASYLTQHQPHNRILVLPEANTRYFRSYEWGFWGSVFLNYALPNPLIEKALVIGSTESELAYNNIIETLNSRNPSRFIDLLDYYDTRLILLDKNADDNRLDRTFSYDYDWTLYQDLIENNAHVSKIWEQGSLSLYKIDIPPATNLIPQQNNNPLVNTNHWYFQAAGDISLIGIFPDQITSTPDDLVISTRLHNAQTQEYTYQLNPNQLEKLPTIWSFDGTTLSIAPAAPTVINQQQVITPDDISLSSLEGNSFVSVGNNLITFTQSTVLDIPITEIPNQVFIWPNAPKTVSLVPKTPKSANHCDNPETYIGTAIADKKISFIPPPVTSSCIGFNYRFQRDSVVTFEAEVNSNQSTLPASLCLHSQQLDRCVNTFRGFYLSPQVQRLSVTLPNTLAAGDDLIAYFTFEGSEIENQITITDPKFIYYDTKQSLDIPNINYQDSLKTLILSPEAEISVSFPTITHNQTGINLKQKSGLLPSIFHGLCAVRPQEEFVTNHLENAISFRSTECFDGLYVNLDPINAARYLVAANSTNNTGIPLEISTRISSQDKKIFSDFIPTTQSLFKILPMPITSDEYVAEVMSRGIGPQSSQNTLTDLTIFPIPQAWLDLKLHSTTSPPSLPVFTLPPSDTSIYTITIANPGIYALPTATSPYWYITEKLEKTTVNGWQQGFIATSQDVGKTITVYFLPNLLAYTGLFTGLLLALWLIIRTRSDSPAPKSK